MEQRADTPSSEARMAQIGSLVEMAKSEVAVIRYLAMIDIADELRRLSDRKFLVCDHYFTPDETGARPPIAEQGCNVVIEGDPEWTVLPVKDRWPGGGYVQLAAKGFPKSVKEGRAEFKVITKNCVPNETVQEQVRGALARALPTLRICRGHDLTAVLCASGPSLTDSLPAIRDVAARPDVRIVCVKHAHDELIDAGIVPWACILLDPRAHVKDFIENPHPDILYIVATMCHPTTFDRLQLKNANIVTYNACVNAGEEKVLPDGGFMIAGGSTAAARSIPVLHAMGFRRFVVYAMDSCYREKPDLSKKMEDGKPRYYEVETFGRRFWTDAELVAQAQDMDRIIREHHFVDLRVEGDGMIAHMHRHLVSGQADFGQLYDGRRAA